VVALASPASAHPGIENPYLPIGRTVTVLLGVPSEEPAGMVAVEVRLPPTFRLDRVDPTPGWTASASPSSVSFRGGAAPQGAFVAFSFAGVFADRGTEALDVVTTAADGTVRHWDGRPTDPFPAPVVFAGTEPPAGQGRGGIDVRGWSERAGAAATLVALVIGVGWRLRRRRQSRSASPELPA